MKKRCIYGMLVLLFLIYRANAANFYVGNSGIQCDTADIAAALQLTASNGPELDTIYITNGAQYNSIGVNISNQSVEIIGGYDDCAEARSGSQVGERTTLLNGAGGLSDSVLEIFNAQGANRKTIILRNLVIINGELDPDGGGALEIDDDVDVQVYKSRIALNSSNNGGAIAIDGTDGATLLLSESVISSNNASSKGGGIYCQTGNNLYPNTILIDQSQIEFNTAASNGGGIALEGSCTMRVYSSQQADKIDFNSNQSQFASGGAIYAGDQSYITIIGFGHSNGSYSSSPGRVEFKNNQSHLGGALYAEQTAFVEITGVELSNNIADGGAGIALNQAELSISTNQGCPPEQACNLFIGNNDNGAANSFGGAFWVTNSSIATIESANIKANSSKTGSALYFNGASIELSQSYVSLNADGSSVIRGENNSDFRMQYVTAANNQDMTEIVSMDESTTSIYQSVLFQPSLAQKGAGAGVVLGLNETNPVTPLRYECIASHSAVGFDQQGAEPINIINNPEFVDIATGDLRLQDTSPLSDLCETTPISLIYFYDINGYFRNQDNPLINSLNQVDAGAYAVHPYFYLVGGASDPFCEYQDIQEAVDASSARFEFNNVDIRIARNGVYNQQAIYLGDGDKSLIGGYQTCQNALHQQQDETLTHLDGSGGIINPVVAIDPVSSAFYFYKLDRLLITGGEGEALGAFGGGVFIDHEASVEISNSWITGNSSQQHGGGIYMNGEFGAQLNLVSSIVSNNTTAVNGGGIFLTNSTELHLSGNLNIVNSIINANTAQNGGGVYVENENTMRITAIDLPDNLNGAQEYSEIFSNSATQNGGGVYIAANAELLVTNGINNVAFQNIIRNNLAQSGGGVFIDDRGHMLISNGNIQENEAEFGGGVYIVTGGDIEIQRDDRTPENNMIIGNTANNSGGGIYNFGLALISNTVFENNSAVNNGSALFTNGGATTQIQESYFYQNHGGNATLYATFADQLDITTSTMAENTSDLALIQVEGTVTNIDRSILWNQLGFIFSQSNATINTECVIGNEGIVLSNGVNNLVVADPGFANPNQNDFHLTANSPGIDYCYSPALKAGGDPIDNDGDLRGINNPTVDDRFGTFDVGADEATSANADILFDDSFE